MGHKKSNALRVSGLSRFLHALNATDATPTADTTATAPAPAHDFVPAQRDPSTRENGDDDLPPLKRRRRDEADAVEMESSETISMTPATPAFVFPPDARALVPHYISSSNVPAHLQKYFAQRTRFFSRYDQGCLLDDEGWYSVTPEAVADRIADRCRSAVVLDAFCGVGGNAIAFARTCERVIALDISPTRLALARHNAKIYSVEDRIEFILADFTTFALRVPPTSTSSTAATATASNRKIDVVFLSPPWGGPSYISAAPTDERVADPLLPTDPDVGEGARHPEFTLDRVRPIHGRDLFALARRLTRNVAYYLPRNTRLEDVAALLEGADGERGGEGEQEKVEVEEEWMGNKLKALTCYFGGLVEGQEAMW